MEGLGRIGRHPFRDLSRLAENTLRALVVLAAVLHSARAVGRRFLQRSPTDRARVVRSSLDRTHLREAALCRGGLLICVPCGRALSIGQRRWCRSRTQQSEPGARMEELIARSPRSWTGRRVRVGISVEALWITVDMTDGCLGVFASTP